MGRAMGKRQRVSLPCGQSCRNRLNLREIMILGIIHTTPVTIGPLKILAEEFIPGIRVINTLDDSLLPDVISHGGLTPSVVRRIAELALVLQEAGATIVLDACSSIGEAVDKVRPLLEVPILRIDLPMAEAATQVSGRIAVLATVKSTMDPTVRLLEKRAELLEKEDIIIEPRLVDGAFDALGAGDGELHDRLIIGELKDVYGQPYSAIVLAQASMARIVDSLPPPPVPVYSSPRPAMARIKQMLEKP